MAEKLFVGDPLSIPPSQTMHKDCIRFVQTSTNELAQTFVKEIESFTYTALAKFFIAKERLIGFNGVDWSLDAFVHEAKASVEYYRDAQ